MEKEDRNLSIFQRNRAIYLKMKIIVNFSMTAYQTDFTVHDTHFMNRCPDAEFIWIVRSSGTHMVRMWKSNELPKAGEIVRYIFSEATREEIVDMELEAIKSCYEPETHDFYHVDLCHHIFRKITRTDAIKKVENNVQKLKALWQQEGTAAL